MTQDAPEIGFDRFIPLDWMVTALAIRAGRASDEDLLEIFSFLDLGFEARIKTLTKIRGLCLAPRREIAEFIDHGVALALEDRENALPAFAWGAALTAYPFFGRVAEIVGRLTSLHGECSTADVHRRMSELYGDRAVVKRAAQAVLQTQTDWGGAERIEGGTRLARRSAYRISDGRTFTWLIESVLRFHAKGMPVASIATSPLLYPFSFDGSVAYAIATDPRLETMNSGQAQELVGVTGKAL
jgi:hypothetical protein